MAGILKFDSLDAMVPSAYAPWTTDGSRFRAENRAELRHRLDLLLNYYSVSVDGCQTLFRKGVQLFGGGDFASSDRQGEGTPILTFTLIEPTKT